MKSIYLFIATLMLYLSSSALQTNAQVFTDNFLKNEQTIGFQRRRQEALDVPKVSKINFMSPSMYIRRKSYNYMDFAFENLWNNKMNNEANAAIIENCKLFKNNPDMMGHDGFPWTTDQLLGMVEYFGSSGSIAKNRLTKATEDRILQMVLTYVEDWSDITYTTYSKSWTIVGSENLQIQHAYSVWHSLKLLIESGEIKKTYILKHGKTAEAHYKAWTEFIKGWVRERGKKSLFVEVSNEFYNAISIKNIYNVYEFTDDAELKDLSRKLLDLVWADWAQEQINGVRGGAKNRIYPGPMSTKATWDDALFDNTFFQRMAYFYCGVGSKAPLKRHLFTATASSYRLPYVVMDMIMDKRPKAPYENTQRLLGLGMSLNDIHNIKEDNSSTFTRYSYSTPSFILGSFHCQKLPQQKWSMISSQNRWAGVIFDSDPDARIFFQCTSAETKSSADRNYNQFWSIQHKGALIIQKLDTAGWESTRLGKYALEMKIWISHKGRANFESSGRWIFFNYGDSSYVAIRVVEGGYDWKETGEVEGKWMVLRDPYSPIIMEVAQSKDYKDFKAFQAKIKSNPLNYVKNEKLTYKNTYGSELTFFPEKSETRLPFINKTQINLAPTNGMNSPFVRSVWGSGKVLVKKNPRTLTLDFNGKVNTNMKQSGVDFIDTTSINNEEQAENQSVEHVAINNTNLLAEVISMQLDAELGAKLSVFPNPANDEINVSYVATAKNTPVSIHLFDMIGNAVKHETVTLPSAGLHTLKIDTSGLPAGTYLLNWATDKKTFTEKVIIIR